MKTKLFKKKEQKSSDISKKIFWIWSNPNPNLIFKLGFARIRIRVLFLDQNSSESETNHIFEIWIRPNPINLVIYTDLLLIKNNYTVSPQSEFSNC